MPIRCLLGLAYLYMFSFIGNDLIVAPGFARLSVRFLVLEAKDDADEGCFIV